MGLLPSASAPTRDYAAVYNVKKVYGAKGDTHTVADGAITSSTTTLTSATAGFTSADTGKVIRVAGAGAASADLVTTIASFTNSTTVTLTASAGTSVTNAAVYWGTDDTTAIQNAINAAFTAGGGIVWIPQGAYTLSSSYLTPKNNVSVVGAGINKVILYPFGVNPAFKLLGSSSTPLLNCNFSDFTIDGSNHYGAYTVTMKGFYIQYLQRCTFERLYIRYTGATGLGNDFYLDCMVRNVIVENGGNLGTTSSAGAAGIGVGVKSAYGGSTAFIGCVTRNCKTYGIFFESQDNTYVQGYSVIDHFSEGNGQSGIGDAGCDGLEVIGGISRNNSVSGFSADAGTIGTTAIGKNGIVSNLITYGNTKDGIICLGPGPYSFRGVKSYSNSQSGLNVKPSGTAGSDTTDIIITDCDIFLNAHAGLWLGNTSGGSGQDRFVILGNRIYNNGSSGNDQHGIDIHSNMTDGMIAYNRMFDDQGASQTQTYGFLIKTGCTVSGNMVIKNNDMRGNKTGAYLNQGNALGGAVVFRDNPGVSDIVTKSSAYTITPADHIVIATGTTTITLPDATLCLNAQYTIKSNDATNTITVATTSSQTIDGATTLTFAATRYEGVTVQSDGSNWWVVNQVATSIL